jgi:hypothetical protein
LIGAIIPIFLRKVNHSALEIWINMKKWLIQTINHKLSLRSHSNYAGTTSGVVIMDHDLLNLVIFFWIIPSRVLPQGC